MRKLFVAVGLATRKRIILAAMAIVLCASMLWGGMVIGQAEDAQNHSVAVGDTITFGTYPQTEAGDDETPIEWLVLDRDGDYALLLSRYALDAQPYNTERVDITWAQCTLRTWLNEEFINRAFTTVEQSAILLTNVDNSSSQGYSRCKTSGGNNTLDKMFLLSYSEANMYLGVTAEDVNNMNARVAATAYALAQGAYASKNIKTLDGQGAEAWWLRSPGYSQYTAAAVHTSGFFNHGYVDNDVGIRPALWINLNTLNTQPEKDETETKYLSGAAKIGSIVTFGAYPQAGASDDKTPIEWLVLDRDGNKALLLSRCGLDAQLYDKAHTTGLEWETCELRQWLNGDFINKAFATDEQSAILLTNVDNSSNQGYSEWSANGGNDTQDKIFLLSYAEANKYLGVTEDNSNNTKSRISPTEYAIVRGANTASSLKTIVNQSAGWWWLRSPGPYRDCAANVNADGSLCYHYAGIALYCVRPALWVDLDAGIF